MKFTALVAALLLAHGAPAFADGKHDHTPKHGGIVVESKDFDLELVAKPDLITVHVRGHGKATSTVGATGKLTILTGSDKVEVPLVPAGNDRMEAKGSFKVGAGTRVVATIRLQGATPANVRFALK